MSLSDFVRKQFVDVIDWVETEPGLLVYRFPMQDREIQNGAQLTVRESQVAVFVNEGRLADTFKPGLYTLSTQTLPVLTYLRNWDKGFKSPFKSDVYFFTQRDQIDQKWGTAQPITIRDKDYGPLRIRGFGTYSYGIRDVEPFWRHLSGTFARFSTQDLEGQLRARFVQTHLVRHIVEMIIDVLRAKAHRRTSETHRVCAKTEVPIKYTWVPLSLPIPSCTGRILVFLVI